MVEYMGGNDFFLLRAKGKESTTKGKGIHGGKLLILFIALYPLIVSISQRRCAEGGILSRKYIQPIVHLLIESNDP